ncbi:MAG: type I glyceraldehyde-3-phosphate dehydrogenase [Chlamydiales bacterium]
MTINVAINGFGRIGRLVYRLLSKRQGFNIVAINDLVDPDQLAYLLKYDSVHGKYSGDLEIEDHKLIVNDMRTEVFSVTNPEYLPWSDLGVDYVIECTGRYTKKEEAEKHLVAGAKNVLISAPAKGDVPTLVMGVNHTNYNPNQDRIVSNASCTTNCLAPLAKVLLDNFGIEEGLMTTIHAVTSSQTTVDGPSKKDWRAGRAAYQNIIPSSTGAAKAVALCIPELEGKVTGMAMRVPIADVSVVDFTVRLKKSVDYKEVCQVMKSASEGAMRGIIQYCDEPLVSSDFIGSTYSAIFDAQAGLSLKNLCKIVGWYDNEMGYAARIADLLAYISSRE